MRTFSKVLLFLLLNIAILIALTKTNPNVTKLKQSFNETESGRYETLLIGQSHSEVCINPFIFSELTGMPTYDLGSSALPTENVYYILKEGNRSHKCKRVIYDIDSNFFQKPLEPGGTYIFPDLTGATKMEYLKDNAGKIPFFSVGVNFSQNPAYILTAAENLKRLMNNEEIIKKPVRYKNVKTYKYKGRGFLYGYNSRKPWKWKKRNFDVNKVDRRNLDTFIKIVEYCKANNIELICVQSAVTPYRVRNQNTEEIHNYFTELCKSYDVPFYDMNYVKKDYMDPVQDDFVDQEGHMYGKMAGKQTKVLAEIIESEDKDKYFYSDYNDVQKRVAGKR